ncbi:MAG: hypothetical protein LKJ88_05360 [Bacilli bacterium]|jgi:lipopolysaccharide export LptBFGC system permease protein LptF|nr:hypothetical protein [Bacilli bacterium]
MDERGLGFFFKGSCIIFIALLVCSFFVKAGTPEFYITIIGLVLTFVVCLASGILLNKRHKE